MKEKPGRSRPVRILRRLAKYAVRLVLAVIIVIAAVLTTIQTPPGKRLLAEAATRLASSPGTSIRFRRISGVLPFRVRLGELRLGDEGGDWLVIEDARVRFDPFEILSFRLHAESVKVDRVTWYRIPSAGEDEPGGDGGGGGNDDDFTPAEIPSFTVEDLLVRKATAAESLFGRRVEALIEGTVANSVAGGPRARLSITPLWGIGEQVTVTASSAADLSRLQVEVDIDDPAGGALSAAILPGSSGLLSFRFRGEGPWEAVKTTFSFRDPDRYEINGDLILDLDRVLLEGELAGTVHRPPFPGWAGEGELHARFTAGGGNQDLSAKLEGRGISGPLLGVKRCLVTAELADLFGAVRGAVSLEADGASLTRSDEHDPDPGDLFGRVAGRFTLHGDSACPGADLTLGVQGFSIPGLLLHPQEVRALNVKGRLTGDRLDLDIKGEGDRGFRLKAGLAAGVSFTTDPFFLDFPADGKLDGSLSAAVDLGFFNNLLALSRQALGGVVEAELTLGGTFGSPIPGGGIVLKGGEYQNLNTGTVLHRISGRIRLEEDRLVLEELSARTPAPPQPVLFGWTKYIPGVRFTPLVDRAREITRTGRVSLSGWTRLSPHEGWPSSYSLRLEDALLADTEILTAIVSGRVDLEGSLDDSRLAGELKLRRAEGRIPGRVAAGVAEIEVIEINKPGEKNEPPPPVRSRPFLDKMSLDLKLTAPNNVLIKGRGLDSEWKADIRVTGRAAAPEVRGGLTLLDGIFIFMGEEMDLENSSVMMDGGYPPDPQIRVNARIAKPDITVTLQLLGTAGRVEVEISSQPPYSQDEILARLIYGRPVSQLSGFQALQIAQGLRTIRGQANLLERLTGWTSFLGTVQVDLTELEGGAEQTALRVRWSLSRNFYIENQRSIESPDNLFLARWEMIKNLELRVQSGYGLLGDAAFLHWQMHY